MNEQYRRKSFGEININAIMIKKAGLQDDIAISSTLIRLPRIHQY